MHFGRHYEVIQLNGPTKQRGKVSGRIESSYVKSVLDGCHRGIGPFAQTLGRRPRLRIRGKARGGGLRVREESDVGRKASRGLSHVNRQARHAEKSFNGGGELRSGAFQKVAEKAIGGTSGAELMKPTTIAKTG